jgi:hypothetical protein
VDDSINILGVQNANKLIHELWHQSIASLQFNHVCPVARVSSKRLLTSTPDNESLP